MKAVVLNVGNDFIPTDDVIINLNNQTNFLESIEILKKGSGYLGVDSSLSVLATKLFPVSNLYVKSQNHHLQNFKHIYYMPQTDFSFIQPTWQR